VTSSSPSWLEPTGEPSPRGFAGNMVASVQIADEAMSQEPGAVARRQASSARPAVARHVRCSGAHGGPGRPGGRGVRAIRAVERPIAAGHRLPPVPTSSPSPTRAAGNACRLADVVPSGPAGTVMVEIPEGGIWLPVPAGWVQIPAADLADPARREEIAEQYPGSGNPAGPD